MGFLTALTAGLAIGGTALSAVGQVKAGNASKAAAEFNAKVAEAQADDAIVRGQISEARYRQGVRVLIGSQRAGFAAQGVDVGVGSPVDLVADTAFIGELDALTIRNNAAREAWGFRMNAQSFRLGGQAAVSASRFSAASTVLGGGLSLLQARFAFQE